jgi:hypothetical protein
MIRHVNAVAVPEVNEVQIVDFTDRRGHDYAVDLRGCVAYMFATMVVCRLFSVSGERAATS